MPLIGQAFRIRNDFVGLVREAATYGDVSTVSVNPILICLVNHPDLIREVLVTSHRKAAKGATVSETIRLMWGNGLLISTGAFHRKQRRLMQPRFHRRYIEKYAEAMTEMSSRKSRQWRDGAMVDMEQEMRDLTLRIVAKTLFDIETNDVVERVGQAFTESDAYLYLRLTQPVFLRRLLHSLPLPSTRRFRAARGYVDGLIYGLIEERRRSGAEGDDLLCLLMRARYEDAENGEDGGMSDEQVRDEAVSLYIAGHDTTATTLTYALYLVSRHPEVEKRLHAELDDVLGDRDATLDDLPHLSARTVIDGGVFGLFDGRCAARDCGEAHRSLTPCQHLVPVLGAAWAQPCHPRIVGAETTGGAVAGVVGVVGTDDALRFPLLDPGWERAGDTGG